VQVCHRWSVTAVRLLVDGYGWEGKGRRGRDGW